MSYTLHPETIKLILEARIALPEISYRKLGDAFSCSKTTAKSIVERAAKTNISLEDLVKLSNDELKKTIYPNSNPYFYIPEPDIDYCLSEIKKHHRTVKSLFDEYKANHPDGLGYTQFYTRIKEKKKHS